MYYNPHLHKIKKPTIHYGRWYIVFASEVACVLSLAAREILEQLFKFCCHYIAVLRIV